MEAHRNLLEKEVAVRFCQIQVQQAEMLGDVKVREAMAELKDLNSVTGMIHSLSRSFGRFSESVRYAERALREAQLDAAQMIKDAQRALQEAMREAEFEHALARGIGGWAKYQAKLRKGVR